MIDDINLQQKYNDYNNVVRYRVQWYINYNSSIRV